MKFDFRESRIISNGNIIKYKYRPMWRLCATARRDDRAAVGWAWTGRNLILDEALSVGTQECHVIDTILQHKPNKVYIFWKHDKFPIQQDKFYCKQYNQVDGRRQAVRLKKHDGELINPSIIMKVLFFYARITYCRNGYFTLLMR